MPQTDVAELFETMAHLSRAAELNQAENKGEAWSCRAAETARGRPDERGFGMPISRIAS